MEVKILFTRRLRELFTRDTSSEVLKSTINKLLSMIDRNIFSEGDFKGDVLAYFKEIIDSKYTEQEERFICEELSLQLMVGAYDYDNGVKDYNNQCKELRQTGMD